MAAARQCDICGNTYPLYNNKQDKDKTNGMMFINITEEGKYWAGKMKDCCPRCMESIKAHVDMLSSHNSDKKGAE